jgi:hypothetical protein
MKTTDTRYNPGSFPKSPVKAAGVSISIFIGLYLAAGGIVRVLHLEAATALARNDSVAHSVDSSAAYSPADSVEPLKRDVVGQSSDQ